MGFDKRENAKKYQRVDGDSLESIAARESQSGNEITWQQLARFNFGTEDPDQIDEFLRDELGTRARQPSKRFEIRADDQGRSDLLIPKRFAQQSFSLEREHTLRVTAKQAPAQFVGCCEIPGVTFAFDKSFLRASQLPNLDKLDDLAKANPDAKVMVFGHTDKVGSDVYNKGLSERRARSAYGFIVNDDEGLQIWESLYNQEQWGLRVVQEILNHLGHDAGAVDGIDGPQTRKGMRSFLGLADGAPVSNDAAFRKKLFKAYMTGAHDVEIAADRFMRPKHMGCGEFNPVVATDAPNEENRRVVFYLFHKDRLPNLPCKEGDLAPCRKQVDAPGPRHEPKFGCSFYDSLSKLCSCDPPKPPVVQPATIEILDAARAVATRVRMGLWDNAFDAAGAVLNNADEPNNFAGADTRRFHFRVKDPSAATDSVEISWKTLTSAKTDLDAAGAKLTLIESPPGSKTFVSKGLLLCVDANDVNQATNSGLVAPLADAGVRNRGQSNHRLKTGSMTGFVKGEYTPASGAPAVSIELPVFTRSPDERRRLPIAIMIFRVAAGGAGVVSTAAGSNLWARDVRVIKETYERLAIHFETVVAPGTPAADIVTVDGNSAVLITAPAGVNPLAINAAAETTCGGAFPVPGHTVRLFYAGSLTSGNRGEAAPDIDFAGTPDATTVFVNGSTLGPYTSAHEIGHMLINKSSSSNGGHYLQAAGAEVRAADGSVTTAGHRFFNNENLMRNGTSPAEGVSESKRLWDTADGNGNNGLATTIASPFTRPF